MKKIVAGMLASTVAALFFVGATPACSSSGPACNAKACTDDPAKTDAQIKACEDTKAGACSSEANSLGSCTSGKDVCTNNKTDPAKALKAASDCANELGKYLECCQKNAGACKG